MDNLNNPFLRGWNTSEVLSNQRGAHQLAALSGLMQLQAGMENAQFAPLRRQLLEAQVAEAARNARIMQMYMGGGSPAGAPQLAFGEGGVSLPGGAQGNVQTGQVVQGTSGAPQVGQLPDHIRLGLMHPKLAPLAKIEAEAYKPTDKMREAIALGFQPGTPQFNAFIGTQFNQGGAWQFNNQGGVSAAPGYAEGRGAIEGAEQRERARYDVMTVPPAGPNLPPTFRSRLSILEGSQPPAAPPGSSPMQIPPAVQAARDIEAAGIRAREGQQNGGGAIPTGRVVAPNAAGMSPEENAAQAAAAAASTATATGRAKAGVDYETGILESGQKAKGSLTQLQILAPNLERLPTGPLYPALINAGGYLQQFGIDIGQLGKDLGPAQATQAVLNQLALKLRDPSGGGGMPGAMSDADRQFLVNAIPGLNKVADGNRVLLDIMMRLEQRKVDEASIVSRMQAAGKTSNEIREALTQFGNSRPLAPDLQRRFR